MLGVIIAIIILVIVYHWVDKGSFYGGLMSSKRTGVHGAIVVKEMALTTKKSWDATRAVYKAEQKSHKMEYARAGQNYAEVKAARDREATASIKKVFSGVNKYLDDTKAEADLRSKECDEFLNSLNSTK